MEIQGVQYNLVQNQNERPRRSRCITWCRRFTYQDSLNGTPPATCKERLIGGIRGLCGGVLFGSFISVAVGNLTKSVLHPKDIVISKIIVSIFGTISTSGTVYGIAHPPRRPPYVAYEDIP